jgi:NADPH:quinone reductase-like Zn-dependent oxidoreductase
MDVNHAVVLREHGGPAKLLFEEASLPPIGPSDVLVRVDSASVSGWDIKFRKGFRAGRATLPGRAPWTLPFQLGREASGVVESVGVDVDRFSVGDRVVAVVHPENTSSPEAMRGYGNLSSGIAIPGHQAPGGYSQYLVREQSMWLPLPDSVDLELAAVTFWAYDTGLRLLKDRLRASVGDTILVNGASGAMGLATIRLANLMGLRSIALTRSPSKAHDLTSFGADHAVVLGDNSADAVAEILELTGGVGVDHAIDFTGQERLVSLSIDVLRSGGQLSPASGEQDTEGYLPVTAFDMLRKELTIVGVRGARHQDALIILDLLVAGKLAMPIAARFPLSQVAEAHEFFESNNSVIGRVILKPQWSDSGEL